ncbi:MAG: helix-turn-helix domain-containing protein, partial [Syntrophomonadaceae bacterium]|nr:helix-turn-helix domain-containing protein [Syntrophomonadaceae bacterium]
MNKRELLRASALQRVIDGSLSIADAAVSLGLSIRQVKRLKKGVVQEGFSFLAHGNRGRTPSHALAPETAQRVLALATSRYAGCNFHHLRDLLAEFESIDLSVSSIRRILVAAGIK